MTRYDNVAQLRHQPFHKPEAYLFGLTCVTCGCQVVSDTEKAIIPLLADYGAAYTIRCFKCHSPRCDVVYSEVPCCCSGSAQ